MLAPVTPIVIPPPHEDIPGKRALCLTRRHAVIVIAMIESVACFAIASLYIYALAWDPEWARILVPIPKDLCNTKSIVDGVMYTIILLCCMELLLALYLFDGARRECLSRARFWLSSMFTYMILVTIVILGMDLGGIRCPTMNSAAFINIFLRFLEILFVFSWTEQESMKRLRFRPPGYGRRSLTNGVSTMTISTVASGVMQGPSGLATIVDCEPTPPPSYSSTIPPGEQVIASSHQRQEPVLTKEDEETERTEQWKKQWE